MSAPLPPDGHVAESIRPEAPRGSRWVLRPVAVAVLVVGLALTGLLAWAATTANRHSQRALLRLDAREAASTLSAALPSVQSKLADALRVATATRSPATFKRFVAQAGDSGFTSETLWRRTSGGPQLVAYAGSAPLLRADGLATRFMERVRPSPLLQVTQILPGDPPRFGFAELPSRTSPYIAYAEAALPPDRKVRLPSSSPFHELNFAVYLGPDQRRAGLIEASASVLSVPRTVVRVPFGDTQITFVASARAPLTGPVSQALPWIAGGVGALLSLIAAATVEYVSRRRRLAESLNTELTALYAEQRTISETLQDALLPQRLASFPGMEIAARYRPGVHGTDVGGDWYDVVALDRDRFVFVVGDVSGRGVHAATVMASLRFASRAFAVEGHSPGEILSLLDNLLDLQVDGHFATVVCGLVDVPGRTMTLANAGHLPLLLVAGGTAATLSGPVAPPVGLGLPFRPTEEPFTLPDGALLLAYTDGLVERRGEDLDGSIQRLQAAAVVPAADLDGLLSSIISDLTSDAPDDDIALIGLRWVDGSPVGRPLTATTPT